MAKMKKCKFCGNSSFKVICYRCRQNMANLSKSKQREKLEKKKAISFFKKHNKLLIKEVITRPKKGSFF